MVNEEKSISKVRRRSLHRRSHWRKMSTHAQRRKSRGQFPANSFVDLETKSPGNIVKIILGDPRADSGDEEKSKRAEKLGTKEKLPLGLRGCVKIKEEMAGFFVGGSVVVLLPL